MPAPLLLAAAAVLRQREMVTGRVARDYAEGIGRVALGHQEAWTGRAGRASVDARKSFAVSVAVRAHDVGGRSPFLLFRCVALLVLCAGQGVTRYLCNVFDHPHETATHPMKPHAAQT
jgi:putative intracellular protease/amidase